MDNSDVIYDLICQGHEDNRAEHLALSKKLDSLESDIVNIKIWKAKVLGAGAGISAIISLGGWVLSHYLSK